MNPLKLKYEVRALLQPRGKYAFLQQIPQHATVCDVGCGNNSVAKIKALRPDIRYIGIDIQAYRMTSASDNLADQLIIADPFKFDEAIAGVGPVDAIISAHNLEHCFKRMPVLDAMVDVLRPGGQLYLSFPNPASVRFPQRAGCLNFYDDNTHTTPVTIGEVLARFSKRMRVTFVAGAYRPRLMAAIGMATEPLSRLRRRVMVGTWEYYGFETIFWAEKLRPPSA